MNWTYFFKHFFSENMSVGKVLMQEDSPHVALASFRSYACISASWAPRDLGKATTWFGQGNGLNENMEDLSKSFSSASSITCAFSRYYYYPMHKYRLIRLKKQVYIYSRPGGRNPSLYVWTNKVTSFYLDIFIKRQPYLIFKGPLQTETHWRQFIFLACLDLDTST